jgi:hypothetical protein
MNEPTPNYFLLFTGEDHEARGGAGDFEGRYDTLEEAAAAYTPRSYTWAHVAVLSAEGLEIVWDSWQEQWFPREVAHLRMFTTRPLAPAVEERLAQAEALWSKLLPFQQARLAEHRAHLDAWKSGNAPSALGRIRAEGLALSLGY